MARGYDNPIWMTFLNAKNLGGMVKKGETGSYIIKYQPRPENPEDEESKKGGGWVKAYKVFNASQIQDLPAAYYAVADTPKLTPLERHEVLDGFMAGTGADIRYGGNRAYYSEAKDYVQLPPYDSFESPEAFAATSIHELAHWSKHPTRLNRDFGRKKWGDPAYAAEEILSELASAYVCADLGLEMTPREEHASYIAGWIKAMKEDPTFIFKMGREAQKVATFLHELQPAISAPSPALTDAPTAPLGLPELPSPSIEPGPPAPPWALVVDRPEKPVVGDWTARAQQKPRQVKKVIGQGDLF